MSLKLGVIDYVNILPLTYGLEKGKTGFSGKLTKSVPSKLNSMLSRGEIDAGFVSSIEYARGDYKMLPYGIASRGDVMSVLLVSDSPLEDARKINITGESATSAVLLKILMKKFFRSDISYGEGGDASLLIGDKALKAYSNSSIHKMDLGSVWRKFSGENMVFSVLAARKHVDDASLSELMGSLEASQNYGRVYMERIASHASKTTGMDLEGIRRYYSRIHYNMDSEDISGLERFYRYAKEIGEINRIPNMMPFSD